MAPLPLQVGIRDAELIEDFNDPKHELYVVANQTVEADLTLGYRVINSHLATATRDVDFVLADGLVTIPADHIAASIDLTILSDNQIEFAEQFEVELYDIPGSGSVVVSEHSPFQYRWSNSRLFFDPPFPFAPHRDPDGTTIDNVSVVSIADDESASLPPWLEVAINNTSVWEGDSAEFDVALSGPVPFEIQLNYTTLGETALDGVDFVSNSGTLVFPPGEVLQTVSVDTIDDSDLEDVEVFSLQVGNDWWINTAVGTATINDDESSIRIVDEFSLSAVEGTNKDFVVALFDQGDAGLSNQHSISLSLIHI